MHEDLGNEILVYMEDFPRTAYEGLSSFASGIAQL